MNSIQTLEQNENLKKWQKEFRNFIKQEDETLKVRFVKKSRGKKSLSIEYGENSHLLVISHDWKGKVEMRFTFNFPFLIANLTVVEADRSDSSHISATLISYALKYWVEVAKLSGAKLMVWEDYNRTNHSRKENPPMPEEVKTVLESYGFTLPREEQQLDDWILSKRYKMDKYIMNLEKDYSDYASSIISSAKEELELQLQTNKASYMQKNITRKSSVHYNMKFYHNSFHGELNVTFLPTGVLLEEDSVEFKRVITSVKEMKATLKNLFNEITEHNKLKTLVKPPRERFNMLFSNLFEFNWRTLQGEETLESIHSFLSAEYDNQEIEDWAATAPSEGKYSYLRENDVKMFNFLDYIFVVTGDSYKQFHCSEQEKAYQLFKDKYLEYYAPKADDYIRQFKSRTGL